MSGRIQNYLTNEGAKLVVLILWLGTNTMLFYSTFFYYYNGPQFFYLHKMLGYGLCISRATAACINLNACVILLPMCRNILCILRSYPSTFRVFRRLLDKSKSFHIACAYMLCGMAVVHCGAHGFNAYNFAKHFNSKYFDINVATSADQHPVTLIVTSVPGITGISMTLILSVITYYASSTTRRRNYRRFWKIHHLFLAFYVLLLFHACSGILKYQTNITEHIPGCFVRYDGDMNGTVVIAEPEPEPHHSSTLELPEDAAVVPELQPNAPYHPPSQANAPCQQPPPIFKSCATEAWRWMLIPLALYALERCCRFFGKSIYVTKVVEHSNNVLEVEFFDTSIKAEPGQSIWIRCPSISALESHPFTLTSVPTEGHPYFTIHMSVVGEWTTMIKEKVSADVQTVYAANDLEYSIQTGNEDSFKRLPAPIICQDINGKTESNEKNQTSNLSQHKSYAMKNAHEQDDANSIRVEKPIFYVNGPYGSPMQDIFRYSVSVCIAGGIGITPYAAVLNMIKRRCDMLPSFKLHRIYLIWICRTAKSFEWFIDLINSVQSQLWNRNKPDFLNVYLYVTSKETQDQHNLLRDHPPLSRCRLETKRPNFKEFFNQLSYRHPRTNVGVFCCGPKSLSKAVRKHCIVTKSKTGTKLIFNKESF